MFTNILRELPLFRIYLFILAGTLVGIYLPPPFPSVVLLIPIILGLITIILSRQGYRLKQLREQVLYTSILSYLILFLIAFGLAAHQQKKRRISIQPQAEVNYSFIEIRAALTEKKSTYQSIGRICSESSGQCSDILVYLKKEALQQPLHIGDFIAGQFKINSIPSPKNPHSFDYAKFMFNQGITGTAYLDTFALVQKGKNNYNLIKSLIDNSRTFLQNVLYNCLSDSNQVAIAQALLLGEKKGINPELRSSFQDSGAMHILAVSGLHVGIIYLLLNQVLFFIPNRSIMKSLIMIFGITTYTLLTGASPSVMRAAIMFAFFSVGLSTKRHINSYNILAASALVLTVANPAIILNIGFQLSYAALLSILYFYKKIYLLYLPSNWLIDKLWQLSAVSLAAQIGTFPLSLFYFHQFPVYFLLSNFVAIPLATIIVYLGVATMLSTFIPKLQFLFAKLLSYVLEGLLTSLDFIAQLPFAISDGWTLTLADLLLLYSIILFIMIGISFRLKRMLHPVLLCLLVLTAWHFYDTMSRKTSNQLNIYFDKEISCIALNEGLQSKVFVSDTPSIYTKQMLDLNAQHRGVVKQDYQYIGEQSVLLNKADFNCLLIQHAVPINLPVDSFNVVVIAKMELFYLPELIDRVKAEYYVFDGTNNPYLYPAWKNTCQTLGLSCYFIAEQGAFIHELN